MSLAFAASYEANVESIATIRNEMGTLARRCGLDAAGIADVRLAVSEAATNVLLHAYRNKPGRIGIEADVSGEELTIDVSDRGAGMRPRTDSPGLGLGLSVIATVTSRLEVLQQDVGTRLRMVFSGCRKSAASGAPS